MNDAEDLIDGICEMFGLDGSLFKDPTEIGRVESADDE